MIWEHAISESTAAHACRSLLDAWANPSTKVFVLRSDIPGESVRTFYESVFSHLGTPRHLAEDVNAGDRGSQRTGGIWMEVRYDPAIPDAYRHSANAQPLHTDGSYIPNFPNSSLLACVANADQGGETTFIDVLDVRAALEHEDPELLGLLETVRVPHARSGDRRDCHVLEWDEHAHRVFWNYYCVDDGGLGEVRDLADRFHRFLLESASINERTLPVKLSPGDAVLWKDDELLHGRNAFSAEHASERFIWKCAFDVGVFESN